MPPVNDVTFDIHEIPFSRRGAWMDLSPIVGLRDERPNIHLVSHQTGMHPVFEFLPVYGDSSVDTELFATPELLEWRSDTGGRIEAVFERVDAVRVRGRGLGLSLRDASRGLTPFTGSYLFTDPFDGSIVVTSYDTGRRYRITTIAGTARGDGIESLGDTAKSVSFASDEDWEFVIEEFTGGLDRYAADGTFEQAVREVHDEFAAFVRTFVAGEPNDVDSKAAYVIWSATVAANGFVRREGVLMSKHWMDKVWSWDHCFNALAMAASDQDAALEQFFVIFDHQDLSGALPDSVTQSEVLFNFVKPPIHGWAFREIRKRASRPVPRDVLVQVHDVLALWSNFWLSYRRHPGHVLPYYQHGNDSGWDNSTTFDAQRVIESPDLAAFLVVQLEVLDGLANELELAETHWREHAQAIRQALFDELWDGEGFHAQSPTTGRTSSTTSLLNAMPIILGGSLPGQVIEQLTVKLESHLTEWGLATEPVDSELYESDGYWRGPIWAPSTYLIVDGLRKAGKQDLADRVSERFLKLCAASGFAENFDAVTGEGLRDRAYTWTAAVYLLLRA